MGGIIPVEVYPLAQYIADEMTERGWTSVDVAARMSDRRDPGNRILMVDLILAVQDEKMLFDDEIFNDLSAAFDISAAYFRNIHKQWLDWPDKRVVFECPEELLSEAALGTPT